MRFGYWLPVFGGWLRNVPDEGMEASWEYVRRLARRSEAIGFDVTLIAELNLNDIKGPDAPALDAWTTTAALAAVTERLELMVAVRPTFHPPALAAKQAAKQLIARSCDAYLMHGDPPERIGVKVADLRARRERLELPPLKFGVAGYVVCRPTEAAAQSEVARITDVRQSAAGYANYQEWIANTQLEQRVSLEDYSVSNRGLKAGLVGTPQQIARRIQEFERAGVDLLLLQFSPQHEEMERFAAEVMPLVGGGGALTPPARRGNLAGQDLTLGTTYS